MTPPLFFPESSVYNIIAVLASSIFSYMVLGKYTGFSCVELMTSTNIEFFWADSALRQLYERQHLRNKPPPFSWSSELSTQNSLDPLASVFFSSAIKIFAKKLFEYFNSEQSDEIKSSMGRISVLPRLFSRFTFDTSSLDFASGLFGHAFYLHIWELSIRDVHISSLWLLWWLWIEWSMILDLKNSWLAALADFTVFWRKVNVKVRAEKKPTRTRQACWVWGKK